MNWWHIDWTMKWSYNIVGGATSLAGTGATPGGNADTSGIDPLAVDIVPSYFYVNFPWTTWEYS
jgi:hypothetical protein